MKKLLLALCFMCLLSAAAFAKPKDDQEFIVKAGIQPQSSVGFGGESQDLNIGLSAGFEYFKYFGNIAAFGVGAVYDLPRKFKDDDIDGSISFLPMYAGVKVRTPLEGLNNNYAFLSGRLGYGAFMYNDIDAIKSSSGGLYYAVGLGVSISYLVLEAVYSVSNYSYTVIQGPGMSNKSYDDEYSAISIYAGFKFE
ncbi:MAG: hypothetical protein LBL00_03150 [Endomicrobium sp.]|jgi:hypothetical protein|nr:hypothetical protein [Endomicrobium sp.]